MLGGFVMSNVVRFPSKSVCIGWRKALEYFLLYKRGEGISSRTLKDYEKHVSRFFKKFSVDLGEKTLRKALLEYLSEDISPSTYNLRLVYLRGFLSWCVSENYLAEDPTTKLKRRKAPPRIVEIELEDLRKLLSLPDKSTFAGLRDFALLLLSLDNGIRPGEALSLLVSDLNLRSYQVHIRAEVAKTRNPRTLPLSNSTVTAIADLMRNRHPRWADSTPLFCSASGHHLGEEWSRRVTQYGKEIGLRIRAYDLRHVFALEFLRNGGDPFSLQRILGHKDMTMTKRYLALQDKDIAKAHLSASPVANLFRTRNRKRKIID
jgi:site-specific recombinase XerD